MIKVILIFFYFLFFILMCEQELKLRNVIDTAERKLVSSDYQSIGELWIPLVEWWTPHHVIELNSWKKKDTMKLIFPHHWQRKLGRRLGPQPDRLVMPSEIDKSFIKKKKKKLLSCLLKYFSKVIYIYIYI